MHLGLVRNGLNPRLIGHRINCLVTSPDAEIAAAPTIYEHQLRPRTSCQVNLLICPKRDRPFPAPMIGASMPPEHSRRPYMSKPFLPKGRRCNNFNGVCHNIIAFRSWVCHFGLPTYRLLTEHDGVGRAALRSAAPCPSLGVR